MKERVRGVGSQRQRYWEEVVRRWKESDQSVREYCLAQGLRESAFYFWRRALARRSQSVSVDNQLRPKTSHVALAASRQRRSTPTRRPATRRAPRSGRRDALGTASFLPVHVVEEGTAKAGRSVEIVLAHGRTVRVPAGFDRQTLLDVLAVLEVQPC
jgi:hypothetical protein